MLLHCCSKTLLQVIAYARLAVCIYESSCQSRESIRAASPLLKRSTARHIRHCCYTNGRTEATALPVTVWTTAAGSASQHPAVLCANCTAGAESAALGRPLADRFCLPASQMKLHQRKSLISYATFKELLMEMRCMWCKINLATCLSRCTSAPPSLVNHRDCQMD